MSPRLTQLLEEMTPQEQTELVAASGSFDWLNAGEEEIYSFADGETMQWPSPQSNAARVGAEFLSSYLVSH